MRLELQHLGKKFASTHVLDDIDLTIAAGEIVAVIGLNGAGKTTLLRCLAGVVVPTVGKILMDGTVFDRGVLALRRRQMFLPDFPIFIPGHSVVEHLAMIIRLYGREDVADDAVVRVLADLDLLPLADAR